MKITLILLFFLSLFCAKSFSQKRIQKFETDNRARLTLLPKNSFGYELWEYIPRTHIVDTPSGKSKFNTHFAMTKCGSGKYKIINNHIILKPFKPKHCIDSISFSKTKTKKDSINVIINLESYVNLDNDDGVGFGIEIKTKDKLINKTVLFDKKISLKIDKKMISLTLLIGNKYEFKIKRKKNYNINVYLNDFKKRHIAFDCILEPKTYNILNLHKITQ